MHLSLWVCPPCGLPWDLLAKIPFCKGQCVKHINEGRPYA